MRTLEYEKIELSVKIKVKSGKFDHMKASNKKLRRGIGRRESSRESLEKLLLLKNE